MLAVFSTSLQAVDAERNHWRSYRVEAGVDLFGTWLVEVTFGRIGTCGRTVTYVTGSEAEARRLARACLRRRRSAPRRIGVAYVTRELADPAGWLDAVELSTPCAGQASVHQEQFPPLGRGGLDDDPQPFLGSSYRAISISPSASSVTSTASL